MPKEWLKNRISRCQFGWKNVNNFKPDKSLDFCRGWGILTLSLPQAEIFIMSDLDLQIFTREATSGKEQESSAGWVEQSAKNDGSYNTDIALWAPESAEPDEGVFFD